MKALIIRPREGKQPTFQLVEFPAHDFNNCFGDLHKVIDAEFIDSVRLEAVTALMDEHREDKPGLPEWWCSLLRKKVKGPLALVSHGATDPLDLSENLLSFDNEEVMHRCRESGWEEWPAA